MNASGPSAGPTASATLHLHPLRRCNLACRHCYSNSSPHATDMLSRDEALETILKAAAWGYQRLAVSGGEPLLYPWLADCLALADDLGMETALITNGLLISRGENTKMLRRVDTVAVSIDGLDDSHNAIRGRGRAFSGAVEGLETLADAGIGFGIVCGVCSANLDEIEEVAELAHQAGARTMQFHPIAETGRARRLMHGATLSADDSTMLYVAANMLREQYAGRLYVHTDLVHRRHLLGQPASMYAKALEADRFDLPPAQLLGVLVVEPDGVVNPVSFGFAPAFGIGNLRAASLEQLWSGWLTAGYGKLLGLGQSLLAEVKRGELPVVFNPSDLLCASSYRAAQADARLALSA